MVLKCNMGCHKGFMGSHEAFAHWLWAWHGWPQWHLQDCHGTAQQLFWTPHKVMAELFGKDHGTWHSCLAPGPGRAPSGWNHGNYMHGWLLIWAANRLVHQQLWPINGKPNLGNTWGETNWLYIFITVCIYTYICTCIYIYIHAYIYMC